MDKKYRVEPEVAGQLGDNTILDNSSDSNDVLRKPYAKKGHRYERTNQD